MSEESAVDGWARIIREQAESLRQQENDSLAKLGEPVHIDTVGDHQYGYWQIEGGVMRMLRHGPDSQWIWHSRLRYSFKEIDILASFL